MQINDTWYFNGPSPAAGVRRRLKIGDVCIVCIDPIELETVAFRLYI